MYTAFSDVPTKLVTLSRCLRFLKKGLDLPTLLVKCRYSSRLPLEMVGQELILDIFDAVPNPDKSHLLAAVLDR
jgi:hypothetical protein